MAYLNKRNWKQQATLRRGNLGSNPVVGHLFNTGSSVDWHLAKPKIVTKFREEDCWDLVEIPALMGVADPNGNIAVPITEIAFTEVLPIFNEPAFRLAYEANLNQVRLQSLNSIALSALGPAARAAKEQDVELDFIKGIGRVESAVAEQRKQVTGEIAAITSRKKDFDKKVAACIKTFNSSFGPSAKSRIETTGMFAEQRFRQCWWDIDHHYATSVASASSTQTQLVGLVKTATFQGGDLGEHVNYMSGLLEQCDGIGMPFNQAMRTQFLVDSILRGKPNRYVQTLELHDQLGTAWPELYAKLQDLDSKAAIARTENHNGHRPGVLVHAVDGDMDGSNVAEAACVNQVGAPPAHKEKQKQKPPLRKFGKGTVRKFERAKCTRCGKTGHSTERCWLDVVCNTCGKKGHMPFQCPERRAMAAAVQAGPNKVQLANVFASKIPKPSTK
jgi:hypothetical protein